MKHSLFSLLMVLTTSFHVSQDSKVSVFQDDLKFKQQKVLMKIDSINEQYELNYTDTVNFEREDWWSFCSVYWEKKRALIDLQKEYFDAFYLNPYLKEDIPEKNKQILKILSAELAPTFEEQFVTRYEPEAPFFSILQIDNNPTGVYVSEKVKEVFSDGVKGLKPINKERFITKPYKDDREYFASLDSKETFRFNPDALDTVVFFQQTEFYAYSGITKESMNFVQFGQEQSLCDPEYFYEVNTGPEAKIGSRYQFDLVPLQSLTINENINKPICYDCPVSKNFEVFAKFKGIEGLFFAYSKDGHTPGAELIMQMKDQYVSIWSNTSDQYGCACL